MLTSTLKAQKSVNYLRLLTICIFIAVSASQVSHEWTSPDIKAFIILLKRDDPHCFLQLSVGSPSPPDPLIELVLSHVCDGELANARGIRGREKSVLRDSVAASLSLKSSTSVSVKAAILPALALSMDLVV